MKLFHWIFLMLVVTGCIDPYNLGVEEGEQLLIVDGFITTEPKTHLIRLARSDTYGNVFEGIVRPFARAEVHIRDNEGNITFLSEIQDGIYATPSDFAAAIGKSYSINIQLFDGRKYISFPEEVRPVTPIDSLTIRTIPIPSENPLLPRSGIEIISHFKDPEDEKNFYQWLPGAVSVYVLIANPELHTTMGQPTPKECCPRCFRTERITRPSIQLADDVNFNGNQTRLPVLFIEDNGLRFRETYRAEISQLSLSEKAYRFLLLAKQQIETEGTIFDPLPANIRSNFVNIDNPEETILGYFYASDVSKQVIYIKSTDLEFKQNVRIVPDDCRVVEFSNINPPDDWNP